MYKDLREAWITQFYLDNKQILLPSINEQLGRTGLVLDLGALPMDPIPFRELFVRWLIKVNKTRIDRGQEVICTKQLVLMCPLWQVVKCPLKKVELTQEGLFNKFNNSPRKINAKRRVGSINK